MGIVMRGVIKKWNWLKLNGWDVGENYIFIVFGFLVIVEV